MLFKLTPTSPLPIRSLPLTSMEVGQLFSIDSLRFTYRLFVALDIILELFVILKFFRFKLTGL